MKRRITLGAQ